MLLEVFPFVINPGARCWLARIYYDLSRFGYFDTCYTQTGGHDSRRSTLDVRLFEASRGGHENISFKARLIADKSIGPVIPISFLNQSSRSSLRIAEP